MGNSLSPDQYKAIRDTNNGARNKINASKLAKIRPTSAKDSYGIFRCYQEMSQDQQDFMLVQTLNDADGTNWIDRWQRDFMAANPDAVLTGPKQGALADGNIRGVLVYREYNVRVDQQVFHYVDGIKTPLMDLDEETGEEYPVTEEKVTQHKQWLAAIIYNCDGENRLYIY